MDGVAEVVECIDPELFDAYERGRLAGIEEGRAAERADVVVWLNAKHVRGDAGNVAYTNLVDVIRWNVEVGSHVGAAGKVVKP
jgi:hypothetical protein